MSRISSAFRREYPVMKDCTFLNWASLSPASLSVIRRAQQFVEMTHDFGHMDADEYVDDGKAKMKSEISRLLNCSSSQVSVCGTSTTQALETAISAVNPVSGDNVVTTDMEFPFTSSELASLRSRGVEIRVAGRGNGILLPEQVDALVDENTKAVVFSSVCWFNGFRADVREISKIAHGVGAYSIVDAVQQAGALRIDSSSLNADFIAFGSQKWLTPPFGCGILVASRRVCRELSPPHPSPKNMKPERRVWTEYYASPHRDEFDIHEAFADARRFESQGWLNHIGIFALSASVEKLNKYGAAEIENDIMRKRETLIQQLDGLDANVISPEAFPSSIVTFSMNRSMRWHISAASELKKHGVFISVRGGAGRTGIRVSIHHANSEQDIERLIRRLSQLK